MKKIVILLIAGLLLTGCSQQSRETITDINQTETENTLQEQSGDSDADKTGQGKGSPDEAAQSDKALSDDSASETGNSATNVGDSTISSENDENRLESDETVSEEWYSGTIGNAEIHARFGILDYKVTGVYYYDKYKTNIQLEGYMDDTIDGTMWMRLTEDTDKSGSIYALFRSDKVIQGFWRSGDTVLPMFLVREGVEAERPKPADTQALAFKGKWYGEQSYYGGSEADIIPIFDDLVYYELNAYNGANSGYLESFGNLENGEVQTIFNDTTYDSDQNVVFKFSIKDKNLVLDSNTYNYLCGIGAGFGTVYTREMPDVPMPTALEAGIVDSEEMDKLFKKITGDDYERFIAYTQYVNYEEITLDGKPAFTGKSYLRGMPGMCCYIISGNNIYAAVNDYENICYYTNDAKYAEKLPEPMAEWASGMDTKIEYNYTATN